MEKQHYQLIKTRFGALMISSVATRCAQRIDLNMDRKFEAYF